MIYTILASGEYEVYIVIVFYWLLLEHATWEKVRRILKDAGNYLGQALISLIFSQKIALLYQNKQEVSKKKATKRLSGETKL